MLLIAASVMPYLARPTIEEARAAIAAGDLTRADEVFSALKSTITGQAVGEVADDLELAHAAKAPSEARLALFD